MKKYYERKATEQPNIEVGEFVMLDAKNIRTKRTVKEVESEAVWPIQSVRAERESGIQARNIA